ncbi:CadA: predicted cadmium-transporting ATPase [Desulfosarcina variabilis str. Montpellier]|uniref:heavy metal translocating P-type ATPase n=1 Tax=Desulfosarcina variabilis TaxID=2300 RepID=UPI003AFAB8C8
MPHGFVRDMIAADACNFRLQLAACLIGGLLLGVSYLSAMVFDGVELPSLAAFGAALLLGSPLVYSALSDLWNDRTEMNELAALSFVVALGSRQYQAAALIAFFLIASQLIEYRSQFGARKNIEALLRLAPQKAWVVRTNNVEEIEATALVKGDRVQVRPGAQIPGDGIVTEGVSSVNQAAITGESLPVGKKPGDPVFSGTINLTGLLIIQITAAVDDSTLSKIQTLISQAETNRTPVSRLINRYVAWYTPIVLMCAAIVLFFTHDIDRAISMLIVACPCTIILSTPTALVAAMSAAARLGVIIKDLDALEVANRISTLIFDKTGTLTTGVLTVVGISVNGRVSETELLALAAGVEQYSTHPVASALMAEAVNREVPPLNAQQVKEEPGCGIQGIINGRRVAVGRKNWIDQHCSKCIAERSTGQTASGTTRLYVAQEKHLIGTVDLADTLRPDAPAVIRDLKADSSRQVIMLTGDRQSAADRIAEHLACDVEAQVLPDQKMARVEAAHRRGAVVGVVGDGINDGPALAAGDVSIAMGAAGSEVAIHSAGIILMNNRLNRVPFILELSRRVVATIRQNLVFSTTFIIAVFFLSAGGMISPVLAAILHTGSSLFVVFNSARLLRVGEAIS